MMWLQKWPTSSDLLGVGGGGGIWRFRVFFFWQGRERGLGIRSQDLVKKIDVGSRPHGAPMGVSGFKVQAGSCSDQRKKERKTHYGVVDASKDYG